jgi:beta-mannosidase
MSGQNLSGPWQLQQVDGDMSTTMQVPGDGISALHSAGLIPDPYWGRNEYGLRWISQGDWVIRRTVFLDDVAQDLVISGLDCVADVAVNGHVVLRAANAFRTWRVDLSSVLQVGENTVSITFRSSVAEAADRQADQPFRVPYHSGNSPIPNGNMLRKPQCDFGWDWNIALAPFGVWGDIRLDAQAAPRLENSRVKQRHGTGQVSVTVTADILNWCGPVVVEFHNHRVEVTPVNGKIRAGFEISDPDLWWPSGQGEQVLHDLTIQAGSTRLHRRIGLRQISMLNTPDASGAAFGFLVNGRKIFAKGANWIPADALSGRITYDGVADLLNSAVGAHMNMIRVWGGGRYEPDWFYDLCDELGLLVWQDFMFSCNLYPSDSAFLADVAIEVREQVARLADRACLALWCGDNELVGALGWFEESRKNRDRYLVAYDRLNRTIETALHDVDPQANWWPSSPSRGPLDFGDGWHDDGAGDMHFWSVWHEGRDFDHYRDVRPRFCSEFGFQSYPSMAVIRRFCDPIDHNIAAPVLESHQKNAGGNARIAETMFRYFRFPEGFENFVYLSQVQQALAIKTAVTHWRSLSPHCLGTLYWQLNDTWPVASWSSLDHGGGWKLLHHAARHFFAPLLVTAVPVADGLVLRGLCDAPSPQPVRIVAQALGMDGAIRPLDEVQVTLGFDGCDVLNLAPLGPNEMLVWHIHLSDGTVITDHHAPHPYKSYDLPNPQIDMNITRNGQEHQLTLSAEQPAFFVALEADQPGRFSDNAVLVLPDTPITVTFTASNSDDVTFICRDLHSATYRQKDS